MHLLNKNSPHTTQMFEIIVKYCVINVQDIKTEVPSLNSQATAWHNNVSSPSLMTANVEDLTLHLQLPRFRGTC